MKTTLKSASILIIAILSAQFAAANEEVYQSTIRSTAWILTSSSSGTGVLVDRDKKLVVTNFHVVKGHFSVEVVFPQLEDGFPRAEKAFYLKNRKNRISATLVFSDPNRDLAILKLDRVPEGIVAIKFAKRGARPGQMVHSIGNPSISDALWVYTNGTVRQVYRKRLQLGKGFVVSARVVETQSPINPGDSGGPIVNNKGELVAISQAFQPKGRLISYGIHVNEIRSALKGENSSVDENVQRLIESLQLPFIVSVDGSVQIRLGLANGKSQMVYINSFTQQKGSESLREVHAAVRVFKDKAPESFRAMVDFANCDSEIGGWEFRKVGENEFLVFRMNTSSTSNVELLKETINEFKQQLETMNEMITSLSSAKTWTASK